MTDVTLPYPRKEAVRVVKAAFERTDGVRTYDVEAGGDVIVGTTDGGLTSFGEEVLVALPAAETGGDAEPETVVSVTAQARRSYNISANPWKHKADFLEELHGLKGTPAAELQLDADRGDGDDADTTTGADATTGAEADTTGGTVDASGEVVRVTDGTDATGLAEASHDTVATDDTEATGETDPARGTDATGDEQGGAGVAADSADAMVLGAKFMLLLFVGLVVVSVLLAAIATALL